MLFQYIYICMGVHISSKCDSFIRTGGILIYIKCYPFLQQNFAGVLYSSTPSDFPQIPVTLNGQISGLWNNLG
jgi:hypothetical protein